MLNPESLSTLDGFSRHWLVAGCNGNIWQWQHNRWDEARTTPTGWMQRAGGAAPWFLIPVPTPVNNLSTDSHLFCYRSEPCCLIRVHCVTAVSELGFSPILSCSFFVFSVISIRHEGQKCTVSVAVMWPCCFMLKCSCFQGCNRFKYKAGMYFELRREKFKLSLFSDL